MSLQNLRFLIDGNPATEFVLGRTGALAVDVTDFSGGDIVFKLHKSLDTVELQSWSVTVAASVGAAPITITVPLQFNWKWQVLDLLPTTFSLFRESCKAKAARPFPTNAWFLNSAITDDLLYPPLLFTVAEPGQQPIVSPTIRRIAPQFVDGNKATLLVDGPQILSNLLDALDSAQHHVHINWFFFAPDVIGKKLISKLIACAQRGVEVRLLFDQTATAVPEPLGQGSNPMDLYVALHLMEGAGVKIADSGRLLPPLDVPGTVTDQEYADRLFVIQKYVLNYLATRGTAIAAGTLPVLTHGPLGINEALKNLHDLGTAGIGTPVVLGGARDHSKLMVIDGKIGFTGGANVAKYYLFETPFDPNTDSDDEVKNPSNPEPWPKWHDCFIRFEGPAVQDLQKFFIERWAVNSGEYLSRTSTDYFPPPSSVGPARIKVITNVPGLERDISAEYLRMFRSSTLTIHVENPYVTDDLLAIYLAHASSVRNVAVDLLVPDKHLDFAIARNLMKTRWEALLAAGIHLYAYEKHMNHCKVATADGHYSIVSSYNFAKSSAAQLFECGVAVDDPDFSSQLENLVFNVDRGLADSVTTAPTTDWPGSCSGLMPFFDNIV